MRSTVIEGAAVGFYTSPYWHQDSLVVNGLNIEADPLPCFGSIILGMELLIRSPELIANAKKAKKDTATINNVFKREYYAQISDSIEEKSPVRVKVNGLTISGGTLVQGTEIKGVALNAGFTLAKEMRGVEISGVGNVHYSFHGVIAGLFNTVKCGHGVQIGLYNYCKKGKVLQIGLLNKTGKRTTPIVNFNFSKHG